MFKAYLLRANNYLNKPYIIDIIQKHSVYAFYWYKSLKTPDSNLTLKPYVTFANWTLDVVLKKYIIVYNYI